MYDSSEPVTAGTGKFLMVFVVIICVAALLVFPKRKLAFWGFVATLPINLLSRWLFPDMNYLIRALIIIVIAFLIVAIPTILRNGLKPWKEFIQFGDRKTKWYGFGLLVSLVLCHIIWH